MIKLKGIDDLLTPMLVKEVRQELRARSFGNVFGWVQAILFLSVLIGVLGDGSKGGAYLGNAGFWLCLTFPLLILIPIRGMQSFSKENKANALELIFLTNLTALQIVLGKWLALLAESALFAVALLPYMLLRYFIGGINLAGSLFAIVAMLGASGVLAAATISGGASHRTKSPIPIIVILVLFGLPLVGSIFGAAVNFFDSLSIAQLRWGEVLPFLVYGLLFVVLLLEIGAARIAPPFENHSFRKRLICLIILAVTYVMVLADVQGKELICIVVSMTLVAVSVGELCDQPRWLLSIYVPYVKRGLFGRLAGRLTYPGWHTGVIFAVIIVVGLFATFVEAGMNDALFFPLLISSLSTLLMPVPLTRILFPKTQRPLACYIGIQVFLGIVGVFFVGLEPAFRVKLTFFKLLIPVTSFFALRYDRIVGISSADMALFTMVTGTVAFVMAAKTLALMAPIIRKTVDVEKRAEQHLKDLGQ